MSGLKFVAALPIILGVVVSQDLPTVYEYYSEGGLNSGLKADYGQTSLILNGKNISIYSGTMHYFRVPRQHWRDRMRKMRAAGLNTLETYIAWNLHEFEKGNYDFGESGSEMQDFLNVTEYLQTAQEEDLLVIVRPGPYICSEFEYGGHPSWLLRDLHKEPTMNLRTNNATYVAHIERWFKVLMPKLAKMQFTKGGPIIAMQVENEYAGFQHPDHDFLRSLRRMMMENGIDDTLFVTSDNPSNQNWGTIPELFFMTANFNTDPKTQLSTMQTLQPNKPVMAMEYWPGWMDGWGGGRDLHYTVDMVKDVLEYILSFGASANMYMFHGGTNFRFLNGASSSGDANNSAFSAVTTEYDYDAPLNEAGDYTDKYYVIKNLIAKYNPVNFKKIEEPELVPRVAYPEIFIVKKMSLVDAFQAIEYVESDHVIPMELLDINNDSGQSYGYIVYRKENIDLEANSVLKITGYIHDTVMVLINGKLMSSKVYNEEDFGSWKKQNSSLAFHNVELKNVTLDLVVENWGRMHWGYYRQFRGLWTDQEVLINDRTLNNWKIYPVEFKKNWTNSLINWESFDSQTVATSPALYKAELDLTSVSDIRDTYVEMGNWKKGIVMVNGFVLGRYYSVGPQQALYCPGQFLKKGVNEFVVFDHFDKSDSIKFVQNATFYNQWN